MSKLQESTELAVVNPIPVEKGRMRQLVQLKTVLQSLVNIDQMLDRESIAELLDSIPVTAFSAINDLKNTINRSFDASDKSSAQLSDLSKNLTHISKTRETVGKMIVASQWKQLAKNLDNIKSLVSQYNIHSDPVQTVKSYTNQHNVKSSVGLFGNISNFDSVEKSLEAINNVDFTKQVYESFVLPVTADLDLIAYYMASLKSSPKPYRIQVPTIYRKYIHAVNVSNDSFKELKQLVDRYVHDNDKSLIPTIIRMINNDQKLKSANDQLKKGINTVYRGIDAGANSIDKIMQIEKSGMVASTTNYNTATNFAHQRGHLEGNISRAHHPLVLTYQVNPQSIVLNTAIFGGVYNESEILIIPSKSKLVSYDQV